MDLLEFGFSLDFDRNLVLCSTEVNHASATYFTHDVCAYIREDLKHDVMLGPFKLKLIDLHVSPFMTREKLDSGIRLIIIDLSCPKAQSLNPGVGKDVHLRSKFFSNCPSVDDNISKLIELGPESLLSNIDISRAFKQLKIDPGDTDHLGQNQDAYFIDQSVPFWYRYGSIFF